MQQLDTQRQAADLLAQLERLGDTRRRAEMATRFGIVTPHAFGVPMAAMQKLARTVSKRDDRHALAQALWDTGNYEARTVAAYVEVPAEVTSRQMDRWAGDFDNWAICDTLCFHLFDRVPHAWAKVGKWATSDKEFVKRAAFALLASLAGHDKQATDAQFLACLPLIEAASSDDRNFVKKGVNWALRRIGTRSPALRKAATALAERLAQAKDAAPRWIGKDALRDLAKSAARLAKARRGA